MVLLRRRLRPKTEHLRQLNPSRIHKFRNESRGNDQHPRSRCTCLPLLTQYVGNSVHPRNLGATVSLDSVYCLLLTTRIDGGLRRYLRQAPSPHRNGRVAPGGCPPGPPTDPYGRRLALDHPMTFPGSTPKMGEGRQRQVDLFGIDHRLGQQPANRPWRAGRMAKQTDCEGSLEGTSDRMLECHAPPPLAFSIERR